MLRLMMRYGGLRVGGVTTPRASLNNMFEQILVSRTDLGDSGHVSTPKNDFMARVYRVGRWMPLNYKGILYTPILDLEEEPQPNMKAREHPKTKIRAAKHSSSIDGKVYYDGYFAGSPHELVRKNLTRNCEYPLKMGPLLLCFRGKPGVHAEKWEQGPGLANWRWLGFWKDMLQEDVVRFEPSEV